MLLSLYTTLRDEFGKFPVHGGTIHREIDICLNDKTDEVFIPTTLKL